MKTIICLVLIAAACATEFGPDTPSFASLSFNGVASYNSSKIRGCLPQGNITFVQVENTTNVILTADSWTGTYCEDVFGNTNLTNASVNTTFSYNMSATELDGIDIPVYLGPDQIMISSYFYDTYINYYVNGSTIITTGLAFDFSEYHSIRLNSTGTLYFLGLMASINNSATLTTISGTLLAFIVYLAF